MSTVRTIESQFAQFIQGLWGTEFRRKIIIQRWFLAKPNDKTKTREIFLTFIRNIIRDPIHFRLDLEKVWFFEEENLALPLSWFSKDEREFLALLVRHAHRLFGEIVNLPSGGFILQRSLVFNDICQNGINRLLILKDFALILLDRASPQTKRPRPELFLHLLISVRTLLTDAYRNGDLKPNSMWVKRLLIYNQVLKAKDVRASLEEIEVFF